MHKNFICHYSPFFDAAFNNSNFVEGTTQTMDLDADPKVFALFVNWVYCQTLEGPFDQAFKGEDYFYLWIMADRFLVPRLQNAVLRKFAETARGLPQAVFQDECVQCVQYIYRNTTKGSPLRRLLLQGFMVGDRFRTMTQDLESCPQEMILEMYAIVVKVVPENVKVEHFKVPDFMVSEELPQRRGALSSSHEPL